MPLALPTAEANGGGQRVLQPVHYSQWMPGLGNSSWDCGFSILAKRRPGGEESEKRNLETTTFPENIWVCICPYIEQQLFVTRATLCILQIRLPHELKTKSCGSTQ